ncbi:chemotaxis protein CheD [Aquabacterium sp.]|uniref:chemotaxis protein CheD n=1 Tax=Aquabacterium sp. TaxID=1872578 RepID=UPI00248808B8|nr:chemotaxis protein CheD [Aquabacterium sp.]MDI1261424.1 chemotaxis protein CheD [Aquabacterium sp.]
MAIKGESPPVNAWAVPATVHVLHPGDVVLACRGDRLDTLLGSCVAIILTDPRRTVAAMCHIVHSGTPTVDVNDADTRHAEPAMAAMFALLRGRGISAHLCEAYLFGGGNMFPSLFKHTHVGAKNADWALQTLDELRIALVGQDIGGTAYRRITWTVGPQAPQVRLGEA